MSLTTLAAVKLQLGSTASDDLYNALIGIASDIISDYCKRPLELSTTTEYYSGNEFPTFALKRYPVVSITNLWLDPMGYFGQAPNAFSGTALTQGVQYCLDISGDGSGRSKSGLVKILAGGVWVGYWPGLWGSFNARTRGLTTNGAAEPCWPMGSGNIKVTYTAGYDPNDSSFPKQLGQACINLVAYLLQSAPNGGLIVTSESLGKQSDTLGAGNTVSDFGRNALAAAGELGTTRQILSRFIEAAIR